MQRGRGWWLVGSIVGLVVVLVVATSAVVLFRRGGHSEVTKRLGASGGVVASKDGEVTAAFGPGDADRGATVHLRADADDAPPPPPAVFRPIDRPFAIHFTSGAGHRGKVSVRYGALPAGADPALVVMLISENGHWRVLPTTFDTATGTATAEWPHFSFGGLAYPSAAWHGIEQGASWSWNQVTKGADWISGEAGDFGHWVGGGLLALAGGTGKNAACDPATAGWSFKGANGDGGAMLEPPLNGCAQGGDDKDDGSHEIKIGNHYPYPYLLDLPRGVQGPGLDELLDADDPIEAVLGYFWSRLDHAVLPAGNEITGRVGLDAGRPVQIKAYADPTTLILKALALAAAFATRGESVEIKTAIRIEWRAWLEVHQSGDAVHVVAAYEQRTEFFSTVSRSNRYGKAGEAGNALNEVLDDLDLLWCGWKLVKDRGDNGWRNLASLLGTVVGSCFKDWAGKTAAYVLGAAQVAIDPAAQAKVVKQLAGQLLKEAQQDLPALLSGLDAGGLDALTAGRFDYVRATLSVGRPDPVPTAQALQQQGICKAACVITGRVAVRHPTWGPMVLLTVASGDADYTVADPESHLVAVDLQGRIRWRHDGGPWPVFAPASPRTDTLGHIFLTYNPGRYDGIVVLHPVANGFEDFGTLALAEDRATTRFYSSSLHDDNGDGIEEIHADINICDPNCAAANYVTTVYHWNGSDYVHQ